MNNELQDIKDEIARNGVRLDNVEGHFDNFDNTLNNHMDSYKSTQREMIKWLWRGFWVLFMMLLLTLGGLISVAIML